MSVDFDVAIVGAGPAGCIAARELAKSGLRIALFDANAREDVGRNFVIEVERPIYDRLMGRPPDKEESVYEQQRTRIFSPRGREVINIQGATAVYAVYFDKITKRMLAQAEEAGARFHEKHKAVAPLISEGHVIGIQAKTGRRTEDIKARLTIDASGYSAAIVSKLDSEMGIEYPNNRMDVVEAENHVHSIDRNMAEKAIGQGIAADDEVWSTVGFAGNYSTEFSHLSIEEGRAYILVGLNAYYKRPTGDIVEGFKRRQGYFGEHLYGGWGRIRVRRTLDRLVTNGLMVVGEAACQVIPANGSGAASGMYAGALAAEVAARALKTGEATTAALWPYAWQYHIGRGRVLATYDMVRLLIERFSRRQMNNFMEHGLMQPEDFFKSAEARLLTPSLASMPKRIACLIRHPGLIPEFAIQARKVMDVSRLYKAYPRTFDIKNFRDWRIRDRELFAALEV